MGGYLTRASRAREATRKHDRTGTLRPTRGVNLAVTCDPFNPVTALFERAGRPVKPFRARPRRKVGA